MKEQNAPRFYKFYKGLMMAFELPESAFIVYMADLATMRNYGHNVLRSKKAHMAHTNIGYRAFDRCVQKTMRMGLLERIPMNGMYDYIWDIQAFQRLIVIVSSTNSYIALKEFCDHVFEQERRTVMSVTDDEITALADSAVF